MLHARKDNTEVLLTITHYGLNPNYSIVGYNAIDGNVVCGAKRVVRIQITLRLCVKSIRNIYP